MSQRLTVTSGDRVDKELPPRPVPVTFEEMLLRLDAALGRTREWKLRLGHGSRWGRYRDRLQAFVENEEVL